MSWLPLMRPGTPLPGLDGVRTLGIMGADGRGDRLVDRLIQACAEHGLTLSAAAGREADVLILLHGVDADPLRAGFRDLSSLATDAHRPRVLVGVAADSVQGAAFHALVRTAALEWSAAWKCVTIDAGADPFRETALELAAGGADREVRISGQREVRTRIIAPPRGAARTLPDGVWIVSGGARGVTAACAIALAHAGAKRIALFGRTALHEEPADCRSAGDEAALKRILVRRAGAAPDLASIGRDARAILANREIRATIAALESAGAVARYDSLDIGDANAVRRTVDDIRRAWGPIRALVHGAGVLADKKLGEKTPGQFESVLRPKIDGARALLEACATDPIEQLCFFSSVAAHAGNPGQSDYAAANAALDRLAIDEQTRRGDACHVVSIAWGPWDGGMVTPALAKHFATRGVGLIPPDAGARAFVDELRRGVSVQVIAGSELGEDDRARRVRFDVGVLPALRDHAISGAVVLPMTLAIDALAGEGRRLAGDCELRDIRLLQGVVFDGGAIDVDLRQERRGDGTHLVTLAHASGRPAYRAEIAPANGRLPPVSKMPPGVAPVHACCRTPYADALFHGPAFQVIREITSCGPDAIAARLATAAAMRWPAGWQLDPAALDGALQLLRVWGVAYHVRPSLPTSVGRCRLWRAWPPAGDVGCMVRCRRDDEYRLSGDALFVDLDSGDALLSLDGIVMTVHA